MALFWIWLGAPDVGADEIESRLFGSESFALDEELPSSFVLALEQDEAGRLWLLDRLGVKVWDGRSLKIYERNEGLGLSRSGDMAFDSAGRPWVVSGLGQMLLFRLSGERWHPEPGLRIEAFVDTTASFGVLGDGLSEGALFVVGTHGDGVWIWRRQADGTLSRPFRPQPEIPLAGIHVVEPFGDQLALGGEHGLCLLDMAARIDCATPGASDLGGRPMLALSTDRTTPSPRLWVWGRVGVVDGDGPAPTWIGHWDGSTWTQVGDPSHMPSVGRHLPLQAVAPGVICPDALGGAYFGDSRIQSRLSADGKIVDLVTSSRGVSLRGITALLQDREKGIWVGTPWGSGRIGSRRFSYLDSRRGLLEDEVTAIYRTPSGDMVFGHNVGVTLLRGDRTVPLSFDIGRLVGPTRHRVFDIDGDAEGNVWLATFGSGVWRLDPASETLEHHPEVPARSLDKDAEGHLWAANEKFLWRLQGGVFEPQAELDGIHTLQWLDIDSQGRLLLATSEGLSIWQGGRQDRYKLVGGDDVRLFTVKELSNGEIWAGAEDGVYRLEDGALKRPEGAVGALRRTVFFVFDRRDKIWLGTDNGVFIWDGDDLRHMTVLHGLVGRETNRGAGFQGEDGRVWIGTDRGVSIYREAYDFALPAPHLELEGVMIGDELRPVDRPFKVEHHLNRWEFHFATVDYSSERTLQMIYQLQGFDPEPVGPTSLTEDIRYTNLPPGEYRFQLQVGRPGGTWSDMARSAPLTISPSILQRPWFWFLLTSTAAALLFLVFNSVRRRAVELEVMNRRLQDAATERERLIASLEAKNVELERFTFTVSHDLKSPLVTIRGFLGFIRRAVAERRFDEIPEDLRRVDAAADKMGQLLNELLELARIGQVANLNEEVDLGALASEIEALLVPQIREQRIELRIGSDLPTVFGDRARLRMALQNLVDNAVKFSSHVAHPVISLDARHDGEQTVITVADNGRGIEPRHQERVFGLFKRLDVATPGTGVGLALVKRVIEAHGGRVEVESEGEGCGCAFHIYLPDGPLES